MCKIKEKEEMVQERSERQARIRSHEAPTLPPLSRQNSKSHEEKTVHVSSAIAFRV